MTELEKIEALQEVYSQMILKAANEAAARVLTSELKARRFEQYLVFTRDKASRLFHLSKQIIRAKSKEVEIKLLNEQIKFDELERRSNETESLILDLRDELNEARKRLSEEKKKARLRLQGNECEEVMPESEFSGYELFALSLESGLGDVTVNGDGLCQEGSTLDLTYQCVERNYVGEVSLVTEKSPPREKLGSYNDSTDNENVKSVENVSVYDEKIGHGKCDAVSVAGRSIRKRKVGRWGDGDVTFGVHSSCQFKTTSGAFQHFSRWMSNQVPRCFNSGRLKGLTKYETQVEGNQGNLDYVQEFPNGESKLAEYLRMDMELVDVMIEQDFEGPQNQMEPIDVLVEQDVFVEQDTEDILKDAELVDVRVEKDELAEMYDLNSSSSVVCTCKGIIVIEAPNVSIGETKENIYFAYSRKRKRTTS